MGVIKRNMFSVLGREFEKQVRKWCEANNKPYAVEVLGIRGFKFIYLPGWQYYFHSQGIDCTQAIMMCVLAHRQIFLDTDMSLSGGELIVDDIDQAVKLYMLYAGDSSYENLNHLRWDADHAPGLNWCKI